MMAPTATGGRAAWLEGSGRVARFYSQPVGTNSGASARSEAAVSDARPGAAWPER